MTAAAAGPHIPLIHAIVLGITQGLSEFLPISSSGHLILVPWLFGWHELDRYAQLNKTFDVALHLGTFVGAVVYFWRDLVALVAAAVGSMRRRTVDNAEARLAWLLVISTIPGGLTGVLLEKTIEKNLGQEWLIAVMLIVFGVVLFLADRARGEREADDFRLRDAVTMGLAQALALQPGVSRSGITISAGRWLGFERDSAARLSFLMSLPIIGGAGAYSGLKLATKGGFPPGTASAFAAGTLASAITGFIAVWALLRFVRTRSFTPFVIYRVLAGAAVLAILATGLR